MKLKEYAKRINEIVKKYGGDLDVIYSCDDEGNYFDYVQFSPTLGVFCDGRFTNTNEDPECICVN